MRVALALVGLAAGWSAGCSIGSFEDLRDEAWADVTDLPEGADGADYPVALAPVVSRRPGTHLVAIAANPPGLVSISYDVSGGYTASGVDLADIDLDAVTDTIATVAAATGPVVGAEAAVAVGGLGARGAILVYDARTGEAGPELRGVVESAACGGALVDAGRDMVWTRTDLGDRDAPDLIMSSAEELVALVDLAADGTAARCVRCAFDTVHSMVAADFDPTSPGNEIAIGVGDSTTSAEVDIFRASLIEYHHDNSQPCFTAFSPSARIPPEAASFGMALAVGHSNMTETPELAIAAPDAGTVYLFTDFGTSGPSGPPQALTIVDPSSSFGTALAFGDLDRDGFDELIIGDAGADVGEEVRAGRAMLYAPESHTGRSSFGPIGEIYKRHPDRDQRFGHSLVVAAHVGTLDDSDVLAVGAAHELAVYFRTLLQASDPRE